MEDENTFVLVQVPEEGGTRYFVYRQVSGPIVGGSNGVPAEALEWLMSLGGVSAARLLPEQAKSLLDKGSETALGGEEEGGVED